MNAILSHQPTTAYDAEISGQDTADLINDMGAIQANLTRSLSTSADCHKAARRALLTWNGAVIGELCRRNVAVLPQPKEWKLKARREPENDSAA
jgi:hypothetical protein